MAPAGIVWSGHPLRVKWCAKKALASCSIMAANLLSCFARTHEISNFNLKLMPVIQIFLTILPLVAPCEMKTRNSLQNCKSFATCLESFTSECRNIHIHEYANDACKNHARDIKTTSVKSNPHIRHPQNQQERQ